MKIIPIILLFFSFAYTQNINLYLTLIEKGRYEEVRENIPDLLSRYPNEPGVKYIQALINNDGDASLAQYKKVIENFPDSEFASQSSIKIGEYLFARGLYSQASAQLKKSILDYPKSDFHQRALDLMINSYIATGEKDSARISLALISDLYPKLDYKKYNLGVTPTSKKDSRLVRIDKNYVNERIKTVKAKRTKAKIFQASTSEVYGDPEEHPQNEAYFGNVNPIGPRSCYDEGKRCAETLFFDYKRQHNLNIRVARIFNTYGPRMSPNDGRVVSNFIVQALNSDPITIYGDGSQIGLFVTLMI